MKSPSLKTYSPSASQQHTKHNLLIPKPTKFTKHPFTTAKMVRISSIAMLVIASALSVQACIYCQCEFDTGAHCCLYFVSLVQHLASSARPNIQLILLNRTLQSATSTVPRSAPMLIVLMAPQTPTASLVPPVMPEESTGAPTLWTLKTVLHATASKLAELEIWL